MASIDLNADLGEGESTTAELLALVSSCNIACGGHAGDRDSMSRTVLLAACAGVAVGAHPAYPDRAGFGRRSRRVVGEALYETLSQQVSALVNLAADHGVDLTHVKPHGALYHDAAGYDDIAEIVARVVDECPGQPAVVGPPRGCLVTVAGHLGMHYVPEAFADRRYRPDGSLVPRDETGAVLEDPDDVAAQAVSIATRGLVRTNAGSSVEVAARTLCVHGDTPGALDIARAVRSALDAAGVDVCRPGRP